MLEASLDVLRTDNSDSDSNRSLHMSADGETHREGNGRLLPALPAGVAARPRPEPVQRADHDHVGPHGGALVGGP